MEPSTNPEPTDLHGGDNACRGYALVGAAKVVAASMSP